VGAAVSRSDFFKLKTSNLLRNFPTFQFKSSEGNRHATLSLTFLNYLLTFACASKKIFPNVYETRHLRAISLEAHSEFLHQMNEIEKFGLIKVFKIISVMNPACSLNQVKHSPG
jgi:hypothetical protein